MSALQELAKNILLMLGALGPIGYVVFVPVYIASNLLLIPNPLLGLAAGALYGIPAGFALVSVSSILSACLVFLAGRYWSRKQLFKKFDSNKKIRSLDDALAKNGFRVTALLRLTAFVPFSFMNYALGLSKIRFRDYVVASWIGMMPGTFLYVYMGSVAGEMVFQKTGRQKTAAEWVLFGISILVALGMGIYATSIVRKAMGTSSK